MPLAKVRGVVTLLPSGDQPGLIRLRNSVYVTFTNRVVSAEFSWPEVGPIEEGKEVVLWAVCLQDEPGYRATLVESTIEPLAGLALLEALMEDNSGTNKAMMKGILDPASHAAREQLDRMEEGLE